MDKETMATIRANMFLNKLVKLANTPEFTEEIVTVASLLMRAEGVDDFFAAFENATPEVLLMLLATGIAFGGRAFPNDQEVAN